MAYIREKTHRVSLTFLLLCVTMVLVLDREEAALYAILGLVLSVVVILSAPDRNRV